MPYLLGTSCLRKSLSSSVEQQDTGGGSKDGGLLSEDTDTSSLPHTMPAELSERMVQPATKAFPAKSSQKSLKYENMGNWIAGMAAMDINDTHMTYKEYLIEHIIH
jgi:hypothetical protein